MKRMKNEIANIRDGASDAILALYFGETMVKTLPVHYKQYGIDKNSSIERRCVFVPKNMGTIPSPKHLFTCGVFVGCSNFTADHCYPKTVKELNDFGETMRIHYLYCLTVVCGNSINSSSFENLWAVSQATRRQQCVAFICAKGIPNYQDAKYKPFKKELLIMKKQMLSASVLT